MRDQLLLALAGLVIGATWIGVTLYSTGGHISAALDDTFIHLQYARQTAEGHFFAYNTADGYSSGATSFFYVLVLAGIALFVPSVDGLLWGAHLLNAALFALSAVLVYRIATQLRGRMAGRAAGVFFLLNGGIIWGFGTGMEIGLFATLVLGAWEMGGRVWETGVGRPETGDGDPGNTELKTRNYASTTHYVLLFALFSALALMRPEGVAMVWEATVLMAWRAWRLRAQEAWRLAGAVALAGVVGLLPLALNLLFTGRLTPNAAEAKLILYRFTDTHLLSVIYFFARFFTILVTEAFSHARASTPFFLYGLLLAAVGGFRLAGRELAARLPGPFLIGACWLLTSWALASTLALTAMSRYIIASYPLFIVFMVVGMSDLGRRIAYCVLRIAIVGKLRGRVLARVRARNIFLGMATVVLAFTVGNAASMMAALGENAGDIYRQQVSTGQWLAQYLPETARVAVNDAGAMKYYGGRYQYDLIGLTTNGAAGLYHLGNDAVFEWLLSLPPAERPDYFAVYDAWFPDFVSLPGFLTPIYKSHLLHNTIAGGVDVAVYKAHWDAMRTAEMPVLNHAAYDLDPAIGKWSPAPARRLVDRINFGSSASEQAHRYAIETWQWNVYPDSLLTSASYAGDSVRYVDSGRVVPGAESMDVATMPGKPLKVVMRYTSTVPLRVAVSVDGQDAGAWAYPVVEGWGEAEILLPAGLIRHERTRLRLAAIRDGANTPMESFYAWFYQ